ncbi:MAG: hypothetical protein M5U28_20125 [Sandaracinaceae bacterium]|nr:hypothetical protein [Sandaracinaceae bacterium]
MVEELGGPKGLRGATASCSSFATSSGWRASPGTLGARGEYRASPRELIDASEPAAEQLSPGR